MSKKFNIGDLVSIVNLPLTGTIIETGLKYKVALSDGFEESFFAHEIVHSRMVVEDIHIKDQIELSETHIIKGSFEEIDLHATFNVKSLRNLTSYEIVERQLDYFRNEVALCKKNRIETLRVIHGKGTGILRNLILEESKKIEYIKVQIPTKEFQKNSAIDIIFLNK